MQTARVFGVKPAVAGRVRWGVVGDSRSVGWHGPLFCSEACKLGIHDVADEREMILIVFVVGCLGMKAIG